MSELLSTLGQIGLLDLVDIAVVTFLIYQGLRLVQGTRGWQMTVGVLSIAFFYYVTVIVNLRTVQAIFEKVLFPVFVFGLIVVFQAEIRRALAEIGKGRLFRSWRKKNRETHFDEIVLAATTLSTQKIGALIVLEDQIGLKTYIESGISLDANLTYDLLLTIFNPKSALHDGAAIVVGDRIAAAGCFLPLTKDPYLSKELGTRHRAAIGVTEETDAVTVVVSEETGKISAVHDGKIIRRLDGPRLLKFLEKTAQTSPLARSASRPAKSSSVQRSPETA